MRRKTFLIFPLFSLTLALVNCQLRKCGRTGNDITEEHVATSDGYDISIKTQPWTVAIVLSKGDNLTYLCTGSLINREYVLTAAHCLDGFSDAKVRDLTLYLGLDDWSKHDPDDYFPLGFQAHIDETFIHPSYEHTKHYFDVALLKMDEKMFYSYEVQPICLPEGPVNDLAKRVGESVTLAAFGGTDCTQEQSAQTENQTESAQTENQTESAQTENQTESAQTENQTESAQTENQTESAQTENQTESAQTEKKPESDKGNVLPNTKLSATMLEVYSYPYCNDYIKQLGGTDRLPDGFISNVLCVGSRLAGHSSCPGDSGGPLVKTKIDSEGNRYHEQIAVVGGATKDKKVGFYARLEDAEILNWVYEVAFNRHAKSNTMLLVSDEEDMSSEIYDLDDNKCNKKGPIFPMNKSIATTRLQGVGGIIKDIPIICGFNEASENDGNFCQLFKCGAWQKGPQLLHQKKDASAIVMNNKLWITGGNLAGTRPREPSKSTELVSLDKSEPFVDLPFAVTEHCITQINSQEFILTGGYRYNIIGTGGYYSKWTHIFNIQSKTWKQEPFLRIERANHGCAVFRFDATKVVVVAGGGGRISSAGTTVEFLRMDEVSKGWRLGPKLPWRLEHFPLVASPAEDTLLAFGGNHRFPEKIEIIERNYTVLEMKCGRSLKDCDWKAKSERLTSPRSHSVAMWLPKTLDLCHADTNILVTSGKFQSSTEIIDMKESKNADFGPDLPYNGRGGVGGIIDYTPIVCSMTYLRGTRRGETGCIIMSEGAWKKGPTMQQRRSNAAGVVVGNKLWVTGGYDGASTELIGLAGSEPFVDLPKPMSNHCLKMVNETTAFLTDFEGSYYFFDMTKNEWSEKFDLPEGFSRYKPVLMGDDLCGTFEFKDSPVVVLAAGNKDRNGISLLNLDNMADGWISGPNLPTSPNYAFSMITTPNKDGVLKLGGTGGNGWQTFDSIWKLTCQESLNDCSWEEQPSKMLLPKSNYLAFWLPNSFCPAG